MFYGCQVCSKIGVREISIDVYVSLHFMSTKKIFGIIFSHPDLDVAAF